MISLFTLHIVIIVSIYNILIICSFYGTVGKSSFHNNYKKVDIGKSFPNLDGGLFKLLHYYIFQMRTFFHKVVVRNMKCQHILTNFRSFSNDKYTEELVRKIDMQPQPRRSKSAEDKETIEITESNSPRPTSIKKLKQSLIDDLPTQYRPHLEKRIQGEESALEFEIEEALSECLLSKSCETLFNPKKRQHDAQFVEIEDVKISQTSTDIYVYWRSKVMNDFIDLVKERKGEEEATKILKVSNTQINKKLQEREGKFRTYLIRKVHFKRVPRIFFKPFVQKLSKFQLGHVLNMAGSSNQFRSNMEAYGKDDDEVDEDQERDENDYDEQNVTSNSKRR